MNMETYVAGLLAELSRLKAQRAVITERGAKMWSRWGTRPFVDSTGAWLGELDRRITELAGIAQVIERGQTI